MADTTLEMRLVESIENSNSTTVAPSDAVSSNYTYGTIVGDGETGIHPTAGVNKKYGKPVNMNVFKRNMSIAKGFMDISLLTANANQLKNLMRHGDSSATSYYIILTLLITSLILQVTTGILLLVKERFDLNLEEDHESAELYNNIVVLFVFCTLLINVFVSSFGIDAFIHKEVYYPSNDQFPTKDHIPLHRQGSPGGGGLGPSLDHTPIYSQGDAEIMDKFKPI